MSEKNNLKSEISNIKKRLREIELQGDKMNAQAKASENVSRMWQAQLNDIKSEPENDEDSLLEKMKQTSKEIERIKPIVDVLAEQEGFRNKLRIEAKPLEAEYFRLKKQLKELENELNFLNGSEALEKNTQTELELELRRLELKENKEKRDNDLHIALAKRETAEFNAKAIEMAQKQADDSIDSLIKSLKDE